MVPGDPTLEERKLLGKKSICLATVAVRYKGKLVGRTIYPQELLEYLRPRARRLYYIEQPMNAASDRTPTLEIYERGERVGKYRPPIPKAFLEPPRDLTRTSLRMKIRDVAAILFFLSKMGGRIDLFIAMEGPNALTGAVLRRVGVVRRTVYCALDYMPKRFANPVLNGLFHLIDKASVRFSDYAWNVSPRLEIARRHYDGTRGGARQVVVPVPSPPPDPRLLGIKKDGVVFLGLLYPALGSEILLRSFRKVLLELPSAKLHVVGEGPLRARLEQFVRDNKLEDNIIIHGMLDDEDADRVVASCKVGVAPYVIADSNSSWVYADSSKGKLYLTYGLPVIITKTAALAEIIKQKGAGLAIDCTEDEIARAIVQLLTDEKLYEEMHRNAISLGSELLPDKVFEGPIEMALSG